MEIPLRYGNTHFDLKFDPERFEVLGTQENLPALSDHEIGEKLDSPIGEKVESLSKPGESFLIVVPDATRVSGCGQIVNLLVRRLIANGTMPYEINIIFATGIHRKVTDSEKERILTPFIAQRIKTLDHDAKDLMQFVRLGETMDGIPIELNRNLMDFDHIIVIGGIGFHYFAGFGGGRKLICPGLASSRTISETHKLAFDFDKKCRREGVATGVLHGNPVHEAFIEIVKKMPPSFLINTIVDNSGGILDLFCGDWIESHEEACREFSANHTIRIGEKRSVVVVSCGGSPHDLNLIQAHKALEAAAYACQDGGKIIFIAKCENGLGREDFLNWFDSKDSSDLAEKLCMKYQVNGQTAWSILKKTERFDIEIVTDLPDEEVEKIGFRKALNPAESIAQVSGKRGYIMPFGAKFKITTGG
ncbi:MAG: nickel-dependent lactate racemase [Pyrinomonadaceae bacterium]